MRKTLLFLLALSVICIGFGACKKSSGDILKGTWKSDIGINASTGGTDLKLVYNFDGKGKFSSYNENDPMKSSGTYEIKQDTLVCLQGTSTWETDMRKEFTTVFVLDRKANPLTLTTPVYTTEGALLAYLRLVKQN